MPSFKVNRKLNVWFDFGDSDALNTKQAPATGARGFTPAYSLWDINASLKTNSFFNFRFGITILSTNNTLQSVLLCILGLEYGRVMGEMHM